MAEYVELRPGMRLLIPSPQGVLAGYFSTAVRRVDQRGVLLDIPRQDGTDLMLEVGQPITLFAQLHGRMYEFETRVIQADLQVLVARPGEAKRTERRAFYRLMITMPCRIHLRPLTRDEADQGWHAASMLDLSGGGARIRFDQRPQPGQPFDIEFELDGRRFEFAAEVTGVEEIDSARGLRFEAHCMFTSIERRDQDAIVKFVFQKQREFSQKGVA